jgi:hypothetical protein
MTTKERIQAAAELSAVLVEEARNAGTEFYPHIVARDVMALMAISRRMTTLSIRQCNEGWDDAQYARAERARDRALKQIREIGASYGFKGASVSGDPRGFVVRIDLASGRKNGWGDGWGVL